MGIKGGFEKVVEQLVENCCELEICNNDGDTALHVAVQNQNTQIARYLVEMGISVDLKNNVSPYPGLIK